MLIFALCIAIALVIAAVLLGPRIPNVRRDRENARKRCSLKHMLQNWQEETRQSLGGFLDSHMPAQMRYGSMILSEGRIAILSKCDLLAVTRKSTFAFLTAYEMIPS